MCLIQSVKKSVKSQLFIKIKNSTHGPQFHLTLENPLVACPVDFGLELPTKSQRV